MNKMTNEEFLSKCMKVHGSKYDYSETFYIRNSENVDIICKVHGKFSVHPSIHLAGHDCFLCAVDRTKTKLEDYILEVNKIHNYKYSYEKINYVNSYTDIIVTCPIHGDFTVNPRNHRRHKTGCQKCVDEKNLADIIEKAKKVHGNKYNYDHSSITNGMLTVNCPEHGDFEIRIRSHLKEHGCTKCSGRSRIYFADFVERSNKVHNSKYLYDKDSYTNSSSICKITCPIHGEFLQKAELHLRGHGCAECGGTKKYTTEKFIKVCNKVHDNKYDYSLVNYILCRDKVIIICPNHGQFKQIAADHINGIGCPKCSTNISKKEIKWIKSLNIPTIETQKIIKLKSQKANVDGYDPTTNTVYEFYGDFWHGNPKVYDHNEINVACKKTFKELYETTMEREKEITELGYNIVSIWESDFDKQSNL